MPNYYDQLQSGKVVPDFNESWKAEQARANQDIDTADVLGAAADSAFIHNSAMRMYERRSSQFEDNKDWSLTEGTKLTNIQEYSPDENTYLEEANSEQEYVARKQYIKEDKDRRRTLSEAGGYGVAAEIGLSLLDPISLVVGVATGGVAYSAKVGKVANVLRGAAVGGMENVAIDAALLASDTQSEATDLIFSLAGGATIGGGIGALSRSHRAAGLADEALDMDATQHALTELKQANAGKPANTPVARYETPVVKDEPSMLAQRDGYEAHLEADVKGRLDRVGVKKLRKRREALVARQVELEARVASTEAELFPLRQKVLEAERASVDARLKGPNKTAEDLLKTAKRNLTNAVSKRDAAIISENRSVNEGLRDIDHTIGKGRRAKASAQKLRAWRGMDPDTQMKALYGPDTGLEVPASQIDAQKETQAAMAADIQPDVTSPDYKTGSSGSVGAASAAGPLHLDEFYQLDATQAENLENFFKAGASVPADLVGKKAFGDNIVGNFVAKYAQGLHTYLSNSRSYTIRGLNYHLFEAPQGGTAAKVTAAARVTVNARKIRAAMAYRLDEGFEDYAKAQGKGFIKGELDISIRKEFWRKVILEAKYPDTFKDTPGIAHAAQGVRDQFHTAGNIRKDAGEAGFDNIDLDKNYVPAVADDSSIAHAVSNHGKGAVKKALSTSYQRGGKKLDKATADNVAEAYIARAQKNSTSLRESYRKTTGKDIDELSKQLEAAGVEKDVIEEFLESTHKGEAGKHMSDRARLSLEPDLRHAEGDVKVIDLFNNNLPQMLEGYTIDASGGAAMAKLGFPTRQSFSDFLQAVEQEALRNGIPKRDVETQVGMIKDGVDMLYGRSINQFASEGWSRNLSRARDVTAILRLQKVGLAAIPESARALTNRGIVSFLREIPAASNFIKGTRAQRKGGKFSGQLEDPELRELDEVMQYAGEDHVIYPNTLRSDEIEETGVKQGLGEKLDLWISQGRRVQELTSFFRAFQGGGEKISSRSLNRNIRQWMYSGDKLRVRDAEINDAGWSDGFLDEMKTWVKANPATDTYNGKVIDVYDFDNMPADMKERYAIGVHRLVARDMQRSFVGETPTFMHKLFGQTITQFRSFSITSLDKQLIHDIRHDRSAGAMIMMWSAGLGAMAYSIDTLISGDEERIESMYEAQNILFGTWNKMGQTASVGIALDGLATVGLMPESMMSAPGRLGTRTYGANSIPSLGLASDVVGAISKPVDYMKGGETSESDIVNGLQKIIPYAKTVGINQAFNAIESELE